jgi:ATP-binding cassette, subfamily B (MDR/TAP), member 1
MDGGEAAETAAAAPALGPSSFMSVFKHADGMDVALMVLGLVGAMGDGMSTPAMLLISSRVTNDFGRGPDLVQDFSARINRVNTLRTYCFASTIIIITITDG